MLNYSDIKSFNITFYGPFDIFIIKRLHISLVFRIFAGKLELSKYEGNHYQRRKNREKVHARRA